MARRRLDDHNKYQCRKLRGNTCRRKIGDNVALSRPSGHFFFHDLEYKAVRGRGDRRQSAYVVKTETLRDENAFFELKVITIFFDLFQIYQLFSVICKTFIVPKHSVYIIVFRMCLINNSIG